MTGLPKLSRRCFLKRGAALAAGAAAAPYVVRSGALAAQQRPGANDRVGVGYIGVGRRGMSLMGLPREGRIVAVADVDFRLAEGIGTRRNCKAYQDYRKMLELKEVDAVVVATPDHWHALPSIHACQAGKDVYCEKPLGLTIHEGRAMVNAARRYRRVFQVGMQRRSSMKHRIGCALVRDGQIGNVNTVNSQDYPSPWECDFPGQPVPEGLDWDVWCGQTQPIAFHQDIYIQRASPGWISLRPYSGGEMTGNGSHGLDLIQWALGMDHTGPVEVWAAGGKLKPVVYRAPESRDRGNALCSRGHAVTFRYRNGVTLNLENGSLGGIFPGEKGKITIDSDAVSSDPPEIAEEALKEAEGLSDESHLKNWLDCIKSREKPAADVEIGHRSTILCHLGNIARWVGRKLQWDPEKEIFPGDDEANGYLRRPMREPYKLPDLG